jgi:hypothetical protein
MNRPPLTLATHEHGMKSGIYCPFHYLEDGQAVFVRDELPEGNYLTAFVREEDAEKIPSDGMACLSIKEALEVYQDAGLDGIVLNGVVQMTAKTDVELDDDQFLT